MKRHKFKSLVKEKVREQARDYLIKLKRSHSKLNDLDESFKMQQYMVSDELTLDEKGCSLDSEHKHMTVKQIISGITKTQNVHFVTWKTPKNIYSTVHNLVT